MYTLNQALTVVCSNGLAFQAAGDNKGCHAFPPPVSRFEPKCPLPSLTTASIVPPPICSPAKHLSPISDHLDTCRHVCIHFFYITPLFVPIYFLAVVVYVMSI